MMPMVAPSRSAPVCSPRRAHCPSRTSPVSGPNDFTRCSAIPMTPSATARVPLPGVTTTAILRSVAAAMSMRSTPTPVRASTCSFGIRSSAARSTTASARTIAPAASARSAGPGCGTNAVPLPSASLTSTGSTSPSATTTARAVLASSECSPMSRLDVRLPAERRSGLETRVVPHERVREHPCVPDVRTAAAEAQLQFVHLLEVPARGAFGSVDLERETALRADDDAGGFDGAHRPAAVRSHAEPDQGRRVVVVLDRGQLAVLDYGEVGADTHGQDRALRMHGRQQSADLADRSDRVLDQVHDVAEQVAKRAAAGVLAAEPPGQRGVGLRGVAAVEHRA